METDKKFDKLNALMVGDDVSLAIGGWSRLVKEVREYRDYHQNPCKTLRIVDPVNGYDIGLYNIGENASGKFVTWHAA